VTSAVLAGLDLSHATHKLEKHRPAEFTTDLRVQRPLDQKRVANIVTDFLAFAIGIPVASWRSEEEIVLLDGQHRNAALIQVGQERTLWTYDVYRGLNLQEEATLFRFLNNTKKLGALELFNAAVTAEDPHAVAIAKLAKQAGFTIRAGSGAALTAIGSFARLYDLDDGRTAKLTLAVAVSLWGRDHDSVHGVVLDGLGRLMFRYGAGVNVDRLIRKMKNDGSDPLTLVGRARSHAKTSGIKIPDAFASILVNIYNKGPGKATDQLLPWDQSSR
jgi:hypothetical protein